MHIHRWLTHTPLHARARPSLTQPYGLRMYSLFLISIHRAESVGAFEYDCGHSRPQYTVVRTRSQAFNPHPYNRLVRECFISICVYKIFFSTVESAQQTSVTEEME